MGPREVTSFPSQMTQKYLLPSSGGEKGWQTDIWENSCCPQSGKFAKKKSPPFPPAHLEQGKAGRRKETQSDFLLGSKLRSCYARHISAKFDTLRSSFAFNMWIWGCGVGLNEPGDSELQIIAVQFGALELERKSHFSVSFADSLLWKYRF